MIKNYLKPIEHIKDTFNKIGIYQLKCNNCPMKYVGQTGRNFRTRFKEHKPISKFAQHVLDTQHTYDTIEKTMDILHIERKGPQLNTSERFYKHSLSAQKFQMNDTYIDIHNPIFNIIIKHIPHNNKPLTNTPSPITT
jgi:hypothetical protein